MLLKNGINIGYTLLYTQTNPLYVSLPKPSERMLLKTKRMLLKTKGKKMVGSFCKKCNRKIDATMSFNFFFLIVNSIVNF